MFKIFLLILLPVSLYGQSTAFFQNGINSPWAAGIDYDLGFAKVLSFNTGFVGGFNSQVNEVATFGDVFFGELNIGMRVYMNRGDKWDGAFLGSSVRVGIYNIPHRVESTALIIDRSNELLIGANVIIGYRWSRNLVNNMEGMPFRIVLEPYLGWSLDFFPMQGVSNVHRFTVGFSFKMGFFTHKKSKATLEAEAKQKLEQEKQQEAGTNGQTEESYYSDYNDQYN